MKDRGSRRKWHFTNVSANDIVSIDVKTLVLLEYDLATHLIYIQSITVHRLLRLSTLLMHSRR